MGCGCLCYRPDHVLLDIFQGCLLSVSACPDSPTTFAIGGQKQGIKVMDISQSATGMHLQELCPWTLSWFHFWNLKVVTAFVMYLYKSIEFKTLYVWIFSVRSHFEGRERLSAVSNPPKGSTETTMPDAFLTKPVKVSQVLLRDVLDFLWTTRGGGKSLLCKL